MKTLLKAVLILLMASSVTACEKDQTEVKGKLLYEAASEVVSDLTSGDGLDGVLIQQYADAHNITFAEAKKKLAESKKANTAKAREEAAKREEMNP